MRLPKLDTRRGTVTEGRGRNLYDGWDVLAVVYTGIESKGREVTSP